MKVLCKLHPDFRFVSFIAVAFRIWTLRHLFPLCGACARGACPVCAGPRAEGAAWVSAAESARLHVAPLEGPKRPPRRCQAASQEVQSRAAVRISGREKNNRRRTKRATVSSFPVMVCSNPPRDALGSAKCIPQAAGCASPGWKVSPLSPPFRCSLDVLTVHRGAADRPPSVHRPPRVRPGPSRHATNLSLPVCFLLSFFSVFRPARCTGRTRLCAMTSFCFCPPFEKVWLADVPVLACSTYRRDAVPLTVRRAGKSQGKSECTLRSSIHRASAAQS